MLLTGSGAWVSPMGLEGEQVRSSDVFLGETAHSGLSLTPVLQEDRGEELPQRPLPDQH